MSLSVGIPPQLSSHFIPTLIRSVWRLLYSNYCEKMSWSWKITLKDIPNTTDSGILEISEGCKELVYAEFFSVSAIKDVLLIVDLITKTKIRECGNYRLDSSMYQKLKDHTLCEKDE